ncbi:MAG: glycosyltransferase family 2 protein [Bifidobacteriaceae bacterium]|jgi:cellulose synthase/poly-beta-1,6-N-acetylglucosamine synthase-like glycosyltransferase|nr:glycosyltransferase family 2 protein [Bifidobacteriaceae bacterium]
MGILYLFDVVTVVIGVVYILYQIAYVIISLTHKPIVFPKAAPKKYGILISARNEEAVIGNLLQCLKNQDYPNEKYDIFVVADNCTDSTGDIARSFGAIVYERTNKKQVGKGWALAYLFDKMFADNLQNNYDAFIIFDADNTMELDYLDQMNKCFSSGYDVVTSYRNSKNFSGNWISSGTALWFIRESRMINNTRMILGNNCHAGGTGFLFSKRIMLRNKGWKHHLITEDLEFSIDCILHKDRIGYCGQAILYDEQPVSFSQSWRQRLRWSKGFLQVFRHYSKEMVRHAIDEKDFSSIDMTLLLCPWMVIFLVREILAVVYILFDNISLESQISTTITLAGGFLLSTIPMSLVVIITVFAERRNIRATNLELLVYSLTFPIYVMSYIPISFQAIFSKPQWKPIIHTGG